MDCMQGFKLEFPIQQTRMEGLVGIHSHCGIHSHWRQKQRSMDQQQPKAIKQKKRMNEIQINLVVLKFSYSLDYNPVVISLLRTSKQSIGSDNVNQ